MEYPVSSQLSNLHAVLMRYGFEKLCILLVLVFWPFSEAYPQATKLKFERISIEQGLSHSTVGYIYQGSRGFMWFASAGLNRYDGYEFKVYKHDPDEPESISSNDIWHIEEDSSGALWIATYGGGLNRFDRASGTFEHWVNDPENAASLPSDYVISLLIDRAGTLWVGTDGGGLSRVHRRADGSLRFQTWRHNRLDPQSLPDNTIVCIYEDRQGALWVGTEHGGLSRFDRATGKFTNYAHEPDDPYSIGSNHIEGICEGASGALWIATHGGGLNRFKRNTESFTKWVHDPGSPNSLSTNDLYAILADRQGMLWLGTDGFGLDRFDPATNTFAHYRNRRWDPSSIGGNEIVSIFEGRAGTLWFGASEGGVTRLTRRARARGGFATWTDDPFDPNDLSHYKVWALHEDRAGNIWVGTAAGLNRFDRKTQTFKHWLHDPDDPHGLRDDGISAIVSDADGRLWIGTWGEGGVHVFDPQTERFASLPITSRTWTLYVDHAGILWHGTDNAGLQRFDPQRRELSTFRHEPGDPASLSNNTVSSICEDRAGRFWVGTWGGGLNRLDRENGQFARWHLNNDFIRCLYQDNSHRLWVGTAGGLSLMIEDGEELAFRNYTEKDGLPSNTISGILEDDAGNLWFSSFGGISKFDPDRGTFRNYDVNDGLQSNEFDLGSCLKSHSGEMYFGGINGVTYFHPDSIKDDATIPPVVITDFQIFNRSVEAGAQSPLRKQISETDEIVLSYKDNLISFEFASLDYTAPAKNQYAYRMEGFDENWIYSGNRRFATYTNLNPGEYTFKVKGSNHDGVWNEEGASIRIIITPPWWQSWWAYLIYGALILAAILGYRRFELSKIRLAQDLKMQRFEAEKLRELDRIKSRFFANISHEFRTPLTLILGPLKKIISGEVKHQTKQNFELMLRNANRLLRLINQLLDLSRLEAGSMALHARPEEIDSLLRQIIAAFESLAKDKGVLLAYKAPAEPVTVYLDADQFEKIMTNLLSNAFKFTPARGKVSISVSTSARDSVTIAISDSGIGIPADHLDKIFDRFYQIERAPEKQYEGTGIGLALVKELIELHGGTINVKSEENRGTTFHLKFRLGKDHLRAGDIVEDVPPVPESDLVSPPETEGIPHQSHEGSRPSQGVETPGAESRPVLLIVEDNADMRAYIREEFLEDYAVLEASDGKEAIEKAAQHIPDLIISDVMMPGMDGFELCKQLKTDERTSHIPVILLTARAASKIAGLETGADDYLTKPFDSKELVVRVKNLIEQRKKLRQRFVRELGLRPKDIAVNAMDVQFLERVMDVIEENMGNPDFSPEDFSGKVGMSRMQLHRKLRALTNQSAGEFIRSMRLKRAARLLQQKSATVTEIAYEVGFNNLSYFSKCFRELFGKLPSDYLEN